ncbi:hypothetical protein QEV70_06795 [Trueperella pyogenes]|uniref:hypothetical protein n=1 Tax=Trueperella pyogenes TaxID=1661 RepID=UPI003251E7B2
MPDPVALFGDVGELEKRGFVFVSPEQRTAAEALWQDAADLIRAECPRWVAASERTRIRVVAAMVKRALTPPLGDTALVGAASASITAGPYSQNVTFTNPSSDLFLSKAEARSLGGRGLAAFQFNPLMERLRS